MTWKVHFEAEAAEAAAAVVADVCGIYRNFHFHSLTVAAAAAAVEADVKAAKSVEAALRPETVDVTS